jgi:hypothetical protein
LLLPLHQHEKDEALQVAHHDRPMDAHQPPDEGAVNTQLREVVLKLLAAPPYAASEHLMCPLSREVMHDPVFAEVRRSPSTHEPSPVLMV